MSDLVERVARAMANCCVEDNSADERDFDWMPWADEASAALRVALEEAARVAEGKADGAAATFYASAAGAICAHDMAKSIATAIRALIPKEGEG